MKKKTKPKIFLVITIIFLTSMFSAASCTLFPSQQGRGPVINLTWWKPFDDPRNVQGLVEQFSKANPNIRIHYVQKNIETYEDELLNALAAGQGPDIFSIHNDWLPKYKDKLVPATTDFWSLRMFRENFVAVASNDFVSEDKIYAAPLSVDVLAMYYNKDIFASAGIARPPATWEALVNLTPRLTRQDNFGNFQRSAVALGTADNINRATDILSLLMLQNGTAFYTPGGPQSSLSSVIRDEAGNTFSPGVRALEFYTQFANPAKVTYTWNNRANNSIEAFASGQAAMIFSYSYLRTTLQSKAPFLNYGIAPMLQIDPEKNRVNFANYWAEAVAKQSPNKQAAWQFLKFITQPEVLAKYYEVQKQPSSRIDLLEKQIADSDIGIFAENALSAKSFYKPDSNAVETIFVQMINDVILRNISIPDAVSAADQKINLLLRNF